MMFAPMLRRLIPFKNDTARFHISEIVERTWLILSRTALIISENLLRTVLTSAGKTDEKNDLIPFQTLVIVFLTPSIALLVADLRLSHPDFTAFLIASTAFLIAFLIASHARLIKSLTALNALVVLFFKFSQPVLTAATIVLTTPPRNVLMPSQICLIAFLIFSIMALALLRISSKLPVTKLRINRTAPKKIFLMSSQTPERMPFKPSII